MKDIPIPVKLKMIEKADSNYVRCKGKLACLCKTTVCYPVSLRLGNLILIIRRYKTRFS